MSEQMIPLGSIDDPDFNSRLATDATAIKELAASMPKPTDLINAITVEETSGRYKLVTGSRRLAAARLNNWTEIRADVRPESDKLTRMTENLVENAQRKDLTTYELGRAISALRSEGMTGAAIAAKTGLSKQHVSNLYNMYNRLHATIHTDWRAGHKAAVWDTLKRVSEIEGKTQEETDEMQLDAWADAVKLTARYQAKLNPSGDDEEESKPKGKSKKKKNGQSEETAKVPYQRFFDITRAVQKSKADGAKLAIQCMKALMGETNKVPQIWDADAGTQDTQ